MVLKKSFFVLSFFLGLICLVSCERVPEWERQSGVAKNSDSFTRLAESKKWLWSCRGVVSNSAEKTVKYPGKAMDDFLDYFRNKGLSSLDTSGTKTTIGSALLWSETGILVSSRPWFENVHDVECSNGISPWLDATVKGSDRSLDLIALKVELPSSLNFKRDNRWSARSDAVTAGERLSVVSSTYPGQIDRLTVSVEPFRTQLNTGIDDDLILFLPPPPQVSEGGVLMDEKWKLVGYLLPHPNPLWGTAITMRRLEESVNSILDKGKVLRPYVGFRLRPVSGIGFLVQQIDVGSPAYQAGLRTQDLLLKWEGKDLRTISDWQELSSDDLHRSIPLVYKRGEKVVETQLTPSASE